MAEQNSKQQQDTNEQPQAAQANEAAKTAEAKTETAESKPAEASPEVKPEEHKTEASKPEEKKGEKPSKDPKDVELEKAKAEIEILNAALADNKDKHIRLMAEFDNFRRRTAKEQIELIETANAKLLGKLSEVLDNFERAEHPDNNKQKDFDAFAKGISMIHDQFAKVLSDAGLTQLDPVGEPFDPNVHEALMNQPSEKIPESHVVQVFQKGYKLKNKLLKTAKVIVSSGPAPKA
ncbi:MAG: nucleotide exchange factor GrpE [Fibrobacteraceae bacterium]|nr:nucleotide exchange factor GrpE [Fibrobacteraceae bacterium]